MVRFTGIIATIAAANAAMSDIVATGVIAMTIAIVRAAMVVMVTGDVTVTGAVTSIVTSGEGRRRDNHHVEHFSRAPRMPSRAWRGR